MHGDFKPKKQPHNLTVNQGQSERTWKCPSDPRCGTRKRRTPQEQYEASMKLGRRFAEMSRAPLVKQDGATGNNSDAWYERQNRLSAGRDAATILMRATMEYNRSKK
jgi:hypothetical protein